MPELYGNKYKWQLREEIAELESRLMATSKELREARTSLDYCRAKLQDHEAQNQKIVALAQEIIAEANRDLTDSTWERYKENRRKSFGAIAADVDAILTN